MVAKLVDSDVGRMGRRVRASKDSHVNHVTIHTQPIKFLVVNAPLTAMIEDYLNLDGMLSSAATCTVRSPSPVSARTFTQSAYSLSRE